MTLQTLAAETPPLPAHGAVLLSESVFAVKPGADLVPEIAIDRAEVFAALRRALEEFRSLGGAAIVDLGGLTTGRDAELLALLTEVTGVQLIASTGFGPAWTVGSHFTNNVSTTGMTVDRIADIFQREITEGLMVPPRERLAQRAGMISATVAPGTAPALPLTRGRDQIEADALRAAARTAVRTGVALTIQVAGEPLAALGILADEGLPAARTLVAGLDRADHVEAGLPSALAQRGYVVGLDHVGWPAGAGYAGADTRIRTVLDLFEAGLGERVIVSSSAAGYAVELPAPVRGDFACVLRDFAPAFRAAGGTEAQLEALLESTPRRLLATVTPED